jgi:hypothetical protein
MNLYSAFIFSISDMKNGQVLIAFNSILLRLNTTLSASAVSSGPVHRNYLGPRVSENMHHD